MRARIERSEACTLDQAPERSAGAKRLGACKVVDL